jgi:hypothetical protein
VHCGLIDVDDELVLLGRRVQLALGDLDFDIGQREGVPFEGDLIPVRQRAGSSPQPPPAGGEREGPVDPRIKSGEEGEGRFFRNVLSTRRLLGSKILDVAAGSRRYRQRPMLVAIAI